MRRQLARSAKQLSAFVALVTLGCGWHSEPKKRRGNNSVPLEPPKCGLVLVSFAQVKPEKVNH